ncbi:MAG: putative arabinose efflux permease, MFS family [Chloroflexi bacterium]|nr:MAG: putative arabinose efflux permease, MFS family [Chloroflexota bacterium]
MKRSSEETLQAKACSNNYGWVVMALLWGLNLVIPIASISIGVMLPTMTEDLDISPVQAGMLGGAQFLGSALVALPASIWLSRFNPKMVIFAATFLSSFALFLQGWASTFTILLAARLLFIIIATSRMQAEVLLIHQWFTPRQIAVVISISVGVMVSGQMMAVGLTPHLMNLLSGWRNVYFTLGVLMLVGSFLWVVVGRVRVQVVQSPSRESDLSDARSPISVLRRYKFLWVLAVAPSGAALAFSSVMTFWPTHAMETLHLSLTEVGALMILFPLGGIAAAFLAGPLSNLLRRRKPFLWLAGILLPPIYVALFTTHLPALAGILLLVAGWNAQVWVPIIRTIPFDLRLAPRETAVATGLSMTILPIVGAMGAPLVGAIQQLSGSLQIGLLSIVAFPLTLLIGGLLIPETYPYHTAQASETGDDITSGTP